MRAYWYFSTLIRPTVNGNSKKRLICYKFEHRTKGSKLKAVTTISLIAPGTSGYVQKISMKKQIERLVENVKNVFKYLVTVSKKVKIIQVEI